MREQKCPEPRTQVLSNQWKWVLNSGYFCKLMHKKPATQILLRLKITSQVRLAVSIKKSSQPITIQNKNLPKYDRESFNCTSCGFGRCDTSWIMYGEIYYSSIFPAAITYYVFCGPWVTANILCNKLWVGRVQILLRNCL